MKKRTNGTDHLRKLADAYYASPIGSFKRYQAEIAFFDAPKGAAPAIVICGERFDSSDCRALAKWLLAWTGDKIEGGES